MKSLESLEKYSAIQFAQITRLQEQIVKLQDENFQLKELLRSAVPISQSQVQDALSTEEEISEREIRKLNDLSQQQMLTFEESKRLLTYVQILQKRREKEIHKTGASSLTDEELFKKLNE